MLEHRGIFPRQAASRLKATALAYPQIDHQSSLFHRTHQVRSDNIAMSRINITHRPDHHVGATKRVMQHIRIERGSLRICRYVEARITKNRARRSRQTYEGNELIQ